MIIYYLIYGIFNRIIFPIFKSKVLLIGVIAGIVILVGISMANGNKAKASPATPQYISVAPSVKVAPYVLATSSRSYYVTKYTDDGKVITLTDWYSYDAKKWVRSTKPFQIDRQVYGEVKWFKRTN